MGGVQTSFVPSAVAHRPTPAPVVARSRSEPIDLEEIMKGIEVEVPEVNRPTVSVGEIMGTQGTGINRNPLSQAELDKKLKDIGTFKVFEGE